VQAGTWLSSRGVAVMERTLQVIAPEYAVAWEVLRPWPAWMPPGEELRTDLLIRNLGTRTWSARGDNPVHLAYTWFAADGRLSDPWDTFRILLPADVPPGGSVTLRDVAFKTPPVLGNYVLRWDLVEEGRTWFFRAGAEALEVPVQVSDRSLFVPWTAQASHNTEGAFLAFDGNVQTAWTSTADQQPGMWFQVDLGQLLVLDRVRVASPGRGFPVGYRVRLSADGQDWHLVAEKDQNWADVDVAFAPFQARYLRLEQTGQPTWPAAWVITEITVSAAEPWAGALASHYAEDAGQAIDARLRTAWNTRSVKQRPGMWFEVDMGSLRRIEGLTLEHPASQMPRGYTVSVAGLDRQWQQVARKDDNWGQVDERFAEVSARYVRVETTNSSPYHPWGIAEFVVWRSAPVWLVGRQRT
ncbi:MAG TPA: discoidin domain-containing protein, partial [Anaerolineae bacterium]|nr:discoidin domain-containing protein [Anaerolineae bacterium]